MVDKNKGVDFPRDMLEKWKSEHAEMIKALLLSHRSPIAYLRKMTKEARIAQHIVNELDTHGALYQPMGMEDSSHVMRSVDDLRQKLRSMVKQIEFDRHLRTIVQAIAKHLQDFMNFTSTNRMLVDLELPVMRSRIGLQLKFLRDDYGCNIPPSLSSIVPN